MKPRSKKILFFTPLLLCVAIAAWYARGLVVVFVLDHLTGKEKIELPVLSKLDSRKKAELLDYLHGHGANPEQYLIEKFKQYDVIMLGEYHYIRHDPLFIQRLIPILYEHGIRILGFEFAHHEDQDRIDRLISARTYDEALAIDILRNFNGGIWPYKEYSDIFKPVWSLNSSLSDPVNRFHILGLTPRRDWEKANYGSEQEQSEQRIITASRDSIMAEIIEREALAQKQRILVYCGEFHAFTRFQQQLYSDTAAGVPGSYLTGPTGTLILKKHPGKVITVILHSPHPLSRYPYVTLAFQGVIDQVFSSYKTPVGFDVLDSPFAKLVDSSSVFSLGYGRISFADLCDGYIILDEMKNFQSATVIETWLDGVSFPSFKRKLPKKLPWFVLDSQVLMWALQDQAQRLDARFQALARQLPETDP